MRAPRESFTRFATACLLIFGSPCAAITGRWPWRDISVSWSANSLPRVPTVAPGTISSPQVSPLKLQTSNFSTPSTLVLFELRVLELAGLKPDFSGYDRQADWSPFSIETGTFADESGRCVRLSREVSEWLSHPERPAKNSQIPLDAAWVIGVFYKFHLDCPSDARRAVLGMIS